ncbi:MAG: hypothetical protein WAN75_18870, partial [Xanthobacteraceae bacterium]
MAIHIRRCELVVLLGGAVATWPLAALGRPPPGFGDYRLSRNGRMRSVMKASSAEPLSGAA